MSVRDSPAVIFSPYDESHPRRRHRGKKTKTSASNFILLKLVPNLFPPELDKLNSFLVVSIPSRLTPFLLLQLNDYFQDDSNTNAAPSTNNPPPPPATDKAAASRGSKSSSGGSSTGSASPAHGPHSSSGHKKNPSEGSAGAAASAPKRKSSHDSTPQPMDVVPATATTHIQVKVPGMDRSALKVNERRER